MYCMWNEQVRIKFVKTNPLKAYKVFGRHIYIFEGSVSRDWDGTNFVSK